MLFTFCLSLVFAAPTPSPVAPSVTSFCRGGAPVAQKNAGLKPYTVTLFKDVPLTPNKANKNFSLFIPGEGGAGCTLFSKEAVLEAGEYTAQGAFASYTSCTDKNDPRDGEIAYAFTKFDSIMGKDILRIQCNKPKSEAQAAREAVLRAAGAARPSDRFAPQALDAKYVLENRASPIRARITTME